MATNTPNLVLRKPDGADLVNVVTDLGANFDVIDSLIAGVWDAYTPVWSATGTAPVVGNGTFVGRSRKIGKTLHVRMLLTMGTTTTYGTGTWSFSLPATLAAATGPKQLLHVFYSLVSSYQGLAAIDAAGTVVTPVVNNGGAGGALAIPSATVPAAFATGHTIAVHGTIEVA